MSCDNFSALTVVQATNQVSTICILIWERDLIVSDEQSKERCYDSTGTIHLKIKISQDSQGSGDGPTPSQTNPPALTECVYFVPDDKHCVVHQGEKYGVFLPVSPSKSASSCSAEKAMAVQAIAVPICKTTNSVKLCFCGTSDGKMNNALLEAAINQRSVDITVCKGKPDKECLILIGVTVPARYPAR